MSERAHKICMLGDFGVGKTSLVARFVRNTFSDRYLTTVGVRVDSKQVILPHRALKLVLWDIAGSDDLETINRSYLRGATGLLVVADGTREKTLRVALNLLGAANELLDDPVVVLLINKGDLQQRWELSQLTLTELRKILPVVTTSALSGEGVEQAFIELAQRLPQ